MPYSRNIKFIEAPIFSRLVYDYLTEDEYAALQWALTINPESGRLIPGSGGLRKLRWAGKGKGKRGGLRIIYYWQSNDGEIWLLTLYAKNEAENIPRHILKLLREEIEK
jgi:mRNA-degrading endonuclease RelE of RelBE toxin-antitoxin system